MPGPCNSSSISSCGEKYPVCGPNTATGCPVVEYWPDTTTALDMPWWVVLIWSPGRTPAATPGAAATAAEPLAS